MKRTLFWLASLVCALLAAIWFVNGLLPSSAPSGGPNTSSPAAESARPAESGLDAAAAAAPVPATATATATRTLPANSVAEIMSLPHDFSQTHAAFALAATADEAAIRQLIADAKSVGRRNDRVALMGIFVSRYSEIDPEAAIEFVTESDLEAKPELLFAVFNAWSKLDLSAAIAAAAELATDSQRRAAGEAILSAYTDAGNATIALIAGWLTAAGVSTNPMLRSAIAMASAGPEAALASALELPRDEAAALVGNIGVAWASQDPEAAFAHSRTMQDEALRRRMVSGVFYAWIDRDPEQVLGLLDGELTNDERSALINNGLSRLAQRDPGLALTLSQRVENAAYREAALQRTFTTWAEADPAAAAAALDGIDSANKAVLISTVGKAYARRAPAAALEWANRISDGQPSADLIAEVARRDPSLALNAALSQRTVEHRDATIGQIAQMLAVDDVTAATVFWQGLPAEHRATAARSIVAIWAQSDADAAAGWVTRMPPGPDQQQALSGLLIMLLASEDAANYGRLLAMVDSSDERDSLGYNRIATLVRNGNRAEAQAELNRLNLSPEAHRRAREFINSGEFAQ